MVDGHWAFRSVPAHVAGDLFELLVRKPDGFSSDHIAIIHSRGASVYGFAPVGDSRWLSRYLDEYLSV